MPRFDGFARTLAFAALAAAGLAVAVVFGAPLFGGEGAARLYLIAAAALYALGLARDRSQRAAVLACGAVVGTALAVLPIGLGATAAAAACGIAFARSALCGRRGLHALVTEVTLMGVGLAVAHWLASGGLLALCTAVWGFFLVQSAYFLFASDGAAERAPRDPFEQARTSLVRLLEEDGRPPR
jgi:hypothetical protein